MKRFLLAFWSHWTSSRADQTLLGPATRYTIQSIIIAGLNIQFSYLSIKVKKYTSRMYIMENTMAAGNGNGNQIGLYEINEKG